MNRRTVHGVDLEAIRCVSPRNGSIYWRCKIVKTGYVCEAGVFNGDSRPKMWEAVERTARICGAERFARDMLYEG